MKQITENISKSIDLKSITYDEAMVAFYIEQEDDSSVIVTRHDVIEEFFRKELGVRGKRLNHARAYEIRGKKVYGSIPLSLMGEVESLTVVHSKYRNDEDSIENMTLEEFKKDIIAVREYKTECKNIGNYYHNYLLEYRKVDPYETSF